MKFINLTPHNIRLNDGRIFEPSGVVARVSTSFTEFKNDISKLIYGDVINLPSIIDDNIVYIVSALVLSALNGYRPDVVAPATGHPDCIRDSNGYIVSVPGFVH